MIVDIAAYEGGQRASGDLSLDDAFERCRGGGFVWLGMHEPTEDEIARVSAEFGIHELAAEDAVHAKQRPKLEQYEDVHLVVVKPARYDEVAERIELGEILLFAAPSFIVAVRHGQATPLSDVRQALEARPELVRLGPGAVVYSILDRVIDDYVPVIAGLEDDVEEVEEQVFDDSRLIPIERIYFLKRQVLEFHRATAPLREPLRRLATGDVAFVHDEVREYFRDVHDHLLRIADRVENLRELLTGLLEAALSRVSVQQNEDMRRISAFVAVATVPILVTGAYGMNLARLPLDNRVHGFGIVLALMLAASGLVALVFRRRGWL